MTASKGNRKKKTSNDGGHQKGKDAFKTKKSQIRPASYKGTASSNPNRPLPDSKRPGFYRDKAKINILNMYTAKPDYDKRKLRPTEPVRVQPDRRWFGNTRVITQTKLEEFRDAMTKASKDPYSVVLKRSKLPISLFSHDTSEKKPRVDLLSIEPFNKTFSAQQSRKKPKVQHEDLSDFLENVNKKQSEYQQDKDEAIFCPENEMDTKESVSQEIFKKGSSRRIWRELYKVVDSSDVIVQVIDARDPMGTRCKHLENHLKKDRPNKHLILLMNKCDLIPSWAASRWVKILSREVPTLAFHSSLTNPFGKMALINLLRQYASLLKDCKHISVGFIGYPNVGKSSVINTLRKKSVCKAAPVPGETKVWQYVALTNRVYLIDCPGVLPSDSDIQDDTSKILKGVVRAERVEAPESHITEVLNRATREHLLKRYDLPEDTSWENSEGFLELLAQKMGKLSKGGHPDISIAARIVLYDWQRGRIPYFVKPPTLGKDENEVDQISEVETQGKDINN